MAKIKHNHFMDTIDAVIGHAKQKGVVHLYAEDAVLNGRAITVNHKVMYHFGTTGYLGLEQDNRLKEAAVKAIMQYGTQFPLSKTYISHPLYAQLEEKLCEMYGLPIIVTKNSTLGHLAVIPCAVRDEDAVIIDHQVHWSVQNAVQLLKTRNIPVEMIRHNDMGMLEDTLKKLSGRCRKVWYMADGVYSMYGDAAPIDDLKSLCLRYPQLHLYYDDVHGMSWTGKHGTGYIMNAYQELPEQVLLFGTLSKTFGASGAVLVCPDKQLYRQIKNFGGPLTFSAQLEPASVAAAVASADIHLSPEIYDLQQSLAERVAYFNELLKATDLPLVATNTTPVFYIGTGMPETGYRFVKRLMADGFFVNLGLFPAVPVKNTGVRITISRHNQKDDIKALTDAMVYHFPKALSETHTDAHRVFKLFKMSPKAAPQSLDVQEPLTLRYETSIDCIDKTLWNRYMGCNCFDWDGLQFLEHVFSNHPETEHQWQFHYFIITHNDVPVLMTFFTTALSKDDMLAPEPVSRRIEALRQTDAMYMTSKVLMMGSLFTEGAHCYLNRQHTQWKAALDLLFRHLEELGDTQGVAMRMLRDFKEDDSELSRYFHSKGFVKVAMPDTCRINSIPWDNAEAYVASLSKRSRKHYRHDIAKYTAAFNIEVVATLNRAQLLRSYQLYEQVKARNYGLNTFTYPLDLFEAMTIHPMWEFIVLYLRDSHEISSEIPVGVMFCYKNVQGVYVPSLIGMDYDLSEQYQIYRQLLYQVVVRAIAIGATSIDFGITAAFEKRKVGAVCEKIAAYVQADDNYVMERVNAL